MTSTLTKTEDDLQRDVAAFLDYALPHGCVFHHSPNEGKRHVSYATRLRKMGTKYGWPDLELFCPGNTTVSGRNEAIFIELKVKRGKLTSNQELVKNLITEAGFPHAVCKSIEEVYLFLKDLVHLRAIM